ncbi:MAG TPA: fluoride efflux transporter CrcB [Verrucomicrobiae bacterium]
MNYLMVAIGGALGSMARLWVSTIVSERVTETFPLGTLVVNITGSFLIGLFAGMFRSGASTTARAFLMTGICGGYTTFSSFSLQNLQLLESGKYYYAGLNTALSFVLCMVAVWLGYVAGVALAPASKVGN